MLLNDNLMMHFTYCCCECCCLPRHDGHNSQSIQEVDAQVKKNQFVTEILIQEVMPFSDEKIPLASHQEETCEKYFEQIGRNQSIKFTNKLW